MNIALRLRKFIWGYLRPSAKFESTISRVPRTYWAYDPEQKFKYAYMHLRSTGKELISVNEKVANSISIESYLALMGEEGVNYKLVDFGHELYVALLVDNSDWQVHAKLSELSLDVFHILFRGPDIRP